MQMNGKNAKNAKNAKKKLEEKKTITGHGGVFCFDVVGMGVMVGGNGGRAALLALTLALPLMLVDLHNTGRLIGAVAVIGCHHG